MATACWCPNVPGLFPKGWNGALKRVIQGGREGRLLLGVSPRSHPGIQLYPDIPSLEGYSGKLQYEQPTLNSDLGLLVGQAFGSGLWRMLRQSHSSIPYRKTL